VTSPLSQRAHLAAVLQALLVTLLWATSWVLIKIGLRDIPALPFAGLRYALAWLCLLPIALRGGHLGELRRLSARAWLQLAALGLLFYSVTQGAQFVALTLLPAATLNLVISMSALLVALFGVVLLGERPTPGQWGGVALYSAGVVLYFYPAVLPAGEALGLAVALAAMLANAGSALLGRYVNRSGGLHSLSVTVATMGVGSLVLLAAGVAVQGLPAVDARGWLIIAWLAVVNTAFAFTLWNHTLRTLAALESSLINSALLVQIPILAWVFLGEALSARQVAALALALAGILAVQLLAPGRRS
jgi:drug/metabolite transporter (DMT)-like permease